MSKTVGSERKCTVVAAWRDGTSYGIFQHEHGGWNFLWNIST
jgi:hypothetical protein